MSNMTWSAAIARRALQSTDIAAAFHQRSSDDGWLDAFAYEVVSMAAAHIFNAGRAAERAALRGAKADEQDQAITGARRQRVLDDPGAYPLHMLGGIQAWLSEMPEVRPIDPSRPLPPLDDMHPAHLLELMLRKSSAGVELMDRFAAQGGEHWDEAVTGAMDDVPYHVAAADADDAAQEAAEIEETHASLMPGRI